MDDNVLLLAKKISVCKIALLLSFTASHGTSNNRSDSCRTESKSTSLCSIDRLRIESPTRVNKSWPFQNPGISRLVDCRLLLWNRDTMVVDADIDGFLWRPKVTKFCHLKWPGYEWQWPLRLEDVLLGLLRIFLWWRYSCPVCCSIPILSWDHDDSLLEQVREQNYWRQDILKCILIFTKDMRSCCISVAFALFAKTQGVAILPAFLNPKGLWCFPNKRWPRECLPLHLYYRSIGLS